MSADPRTELLRRYPRAIAHMRQQLRAQEFGMIFGAGASMPYGFPTWTQLLARISKRLKAGDEVLNLPSALCAETLFQTFRQRNRPPDSDALSFSEIALVEDAQWRRLVHRCLYERADKRVPWAKDLYGWFADVVANAQITINYNFDDRLERTLHKRHAARRLDYQPPASQSDEYAPATRGYEVISSPLISNKPGLNARIYHPNGYLPKAIHDGSTSITFSQTSFADQLLLSGTAEYAPLLTLLRMQTFLLVGLSLEDETLRHVLRQHATVDPSSVNYYVRYTGERRPSKAQQQAIRSANFESFSLITLFVDDDELRVLSEMLRMDETEFVNLCGQARVASTRTFYVTGAVGVGKSSVTRSFRDLQTIDEWSETRPEELNRPPRPDDETLEESDRWIANQMSLRNTALKRLKRSGIRVVDRSPIDPVVFTPDHRYNVKARWLAKALDIEGRPLADGHVIVLLGDPAELRTRVRARFKDAEVSDIADQQDLIVSLFPDDDGRTTHHIQTRGVSLRQLIKLIVREIHLGDNSSYAEVDMNERLMAVASGDQRLRRRPRGRSGAKRDR